jgi:hypothetical protein
MQTMTKLGKILLYVNLALSLVFAFWGFGIYSNRVDWSAEKKGEYAKRAEIITGLKGARDRAEARWAAIRPYPLPDPRNVKFPPQSVAAYEQFRDRLHKTQADLLQNLIIGDNIKDLVLAPDGALKLTPDGMPELGPVMNRKKQLIPNLKGITKLNKEYDDAQVDIRTTTQAIDKLIDEEKKLSVAIGNGTAKDGIPVGLRARLAARQQEEKRSLDEQEYLQPKLYNRQEEKKLLLSRQKELQDRLRELQAVAARARP